MSERLKMSTVTTLGKNDDAGQAQRLKKEILRLHACIKAVAISRWGSTLARCSKAGIYPTKSEVC